MGKGVFFPLFAAGAAACTRKNDCNPITGMLYLNSFKGLNGQFRERAGIQL